MIPRRLLGFELCLVLLAVSFPLSASPTLEDDLSRIFVGRSFTIRNFYRGSHLYYGSNGELSEKAETGYWSRDGMVEFSSVKISSDNKLIMDGKRTCILLDRKQGEFSNVTTGDRVEIEVQLSPDQLTVQAVLPLLQKILLSSRDRLADFVPSYWANCLSRKVDRRDKHSLWECAATEGRDIPDFAGKKVSWDLPQPDNSLHNGMQMYTVVHRVGYLEEEGVALPRLLAAPDPIFQWEQRRKTLDATALVLSFIVGTDGKPHNIMIVSPVGMGLDDEAAEALAKWTFTPGKQNGQLHAVHARVFFDITSPNTRLNPR